MLVLVGSYYFGIFFERLIKKIPKKKATQKITIDFLRIFITKQSLRTKIFIAGLWGLLFGVIINPYFPRDLIFYWYQIFQVGLINYQKIIGVGAEWYPYQLPELLVNAALTFLLLLPALILFLVDFKKQGRKTISLFFLNFFFLILTLKSRRYVEYFIPFSILFSAFSINLAAKTKTLAQLFLTIRQFPRYIKFLFLPLLICFIVLFSLTVFKGAEENKKSLAHGAPFTRFQKVSQWLSQNTPEHSIIFHDNWDSSPYLFYYNTHNYYLVGLDPTFMYLANQNLYWSWVNITTGKQTGNLKKTIQEKFHSNYVFVDKNHQSLENNLIKSNDFKLVYQDEEARVYEIK